MDRIQFRRDTLANWNSVNPILLEGEIGYVLDDPNLHKIGDGVHTWNQLPFRGFDGTIVHDTGDSENAVMSQKGVTAKLSELGSEVIGYYHSGECTAQEFVKIPIIAKGVEFVNKSSFGLYVSEFNNNSNLVWVNAGSKAKVEFNVQYINPSNNSGTFALEVKASVLLIKNQELTGKEKSCVRTNIGAIDSELLKDSFNKLASSKNLVDPAKLTTGYLNIDGSLTDTQWYHTCDFIKIVAGQKIAISPKIIRLMEFDKYKEPIPSTYYNGNIENYIYTPINDGFLKVTFVMSDNYQIEYGDKVTEYTPYKLQLSEDISFSDSQDKHIGGIVSDKIKFLTSNTGERITENITDLLNIEEGIYYDENGIRSTNSNYKSIRIDVNEGDLLSISADVNARNIIVFGKEDRVLRSASYVLSVNCPEDSKYVYISFASSAVITKVIHEYTEAINNATEFTYSSNYFDEENIEIGKWMKPDGSSGNDNNYCVTDYIPVKEGESIIIGDSIRIKRNFFSIIAYDKYYSLIAEKGKYDENRFTKYVVPQGVSFIKACIGINVIKEDTAINKSNELLKYEPFNISVMPRGTMERNSFENAIKNRPFSTIPNLLGVAKYRPLGVLSKPYICITSDDGYGQMASVSIPMAIRKDIPITFYVMKESEVFVDENNIQIIKDAINSGHCELGQHGYTPFVDYTEEQLNVYLDYQKKFFDSIGVEVKSSSTPTGQYNDIVNAVCGNRFGVNRNLNGEIEYGEYGMYANGPRSNVYALTSCGMKDHGIDTHRWYLDKAYSSNYLYIMHFHDDDFDNIPGSLQLYESIIDYAKEKGFTFIKASQIPYLK